MVVSLDDFRRLLYDLYPIHASSIVVNTIVPPLLMTWILKGSLRSVYLEGPRKKTYVKRENETMSLGRHTVPAIGHNGAGVKIENFAN